MDTSEKVRRVLIFGTQFSCTLLWMSDFEHAALLLTTWIKPILSSQGPSLRKTYSSLLTCVYFVEPGSVIQVVNPYFPTMSIKNDGGRIIVRHSKDHVDWCTQLYRWKIRSMTDNIWYFICHCSPSFSLVTIDMTSTGVFFHHELY